MKHTLLNTWLAGYESKAYALGDLNKKTKSRFRLNRLYEWATSPDTPPYPPDHVKKYMRKCVLATVLLDEGITGLSKQQQTRIVNKLS